MRDPSELVWLKVVNNDFWWTNIINGIKIANVDGSEKEYAIDSTYGMTDTGTSCVYIPTQYYYSILN